MGDTSLTGRKIIVDALMAGVSAHESGGLSQVKTQPRSIARAYMARYVAKSCVLCRSK